MIEYLNLNSKTITYTNARESNKVATKKNRRNKRFPLTKRSTCHFGIRGCLEYLSFSSCV